MGAHIPKLEERASALWASAVRPMIRPTASSRAAGSIRLVVSSRRTLHHQNFSLEDLSQHKVLFSLSSDAITERRKVQNLDAAGYSEMEVRSYVIDPIVKAIEYGERNDILSGSGAAC